MYRFTTGFGYLVNKVGARIGDLFSRDLAPYGVTVLMYRVLAGLWEKGDQQLGELSVMTTIELSTLSRLVSAMKRKGLVSRVRVQTDERSIRINLTAKGRALATEVMAIAARQEAVYVLTLGEDEMTILKRSLTTVFNNLDQLERKNANVALKPIFRRRTLDRRAARRGGREARSS